MHTGRELRDFLTSRRASLTPEEVGLPRPHAHRRVKGLRREEVAILAGVSVDYYAKLEQGRQHLRTGAGLDRGRAAPGRPRAQAPALAAERRRRPHAPASPDREGTA